MIQRSQYGVSSAKLNYTELMEQGNNFLRLAEIPGLSCKKLIKCLKMVVILKSSLLHFPVASMASISMLLCMRAFIMNLRVSQIPPNFIYLLHVSLLMDRSHDYISCQSPLSLSKLELQLEICSSSLLKLSKGCFYRNFGCSQFHIMGKI